MQVFKLWETPERTIIIAYYPLGIIVNAGVVDDEKHFTAFGQIPDGLCYLHRHLHVKGVVHRNLEPENFLIRIVSFFKVVIADPSITKPGGKRYNNIDYNPGQETYLKRMVTACSKPPDLTITNASCKYHK